MSTRIEQLIDEIQDYINDCKPRTFSSTEIIVNKEHINDLLEELRTKTPEEIKRYSKIVSNKEAILNDAREKAQQLINEATIKTNELVSQHEIMQQAYAKAQEYVSMAVQKAQKILDDAVAESNEIREGAMRYAEDTLRNTDAIIVKAMESGRASFDEYYSSMMAGHNVVCTNLNALCPPETTEEDSDLLQEDALNE